MSMRVVFVRIYVYCVHAWCLQGPEEGAALPGTRVSDGWSLHVGAGSQAHVLWKSILYS